MGKHRQEATLLRSSLFLRFSLLHCACTKMKFVAVFLIAAAFVCVSCQDDAAAAAAGETENAADALESGAGAGDTTIKPASGGAGGPTTRHTGSTKPNGGGGSGGGGSDGKGSSSGAGINYPQVFIVICVYMFSFLGTAYIS